MIDKDMNRAESYMVVPSIHAGTYAAASPLGTVHYRSTQIQCRKAVCRWSTYLGNFRKDRCRRLLVEEQIYDWGNRDGEYILHLFVNIGLKLLPQIYLVLVFTSTLLPAMCLLPLYPLLKYRFFPPSPIEQYRTSLEAIQRSNEAAELADEMTETSMDGGQAESGNQLGQGVGVGFDFRTAGDTLGLGRAGMVMEELMAGRAGGAVGSSQEEVVDGEPEGPDDDLPAGETGEKKTKTKRKKVRTRIAEFEAEYGAGLVVVLGDLAVCFVRTSCDI